MMKDEISTNRQGNCLSLIRMIAAFQVMLGHVIEHYELPGNATVLHATYFLRGVPIFFVISGFLMWFSMGRSRTYLQYLKKRFWRIFPELWAAVFVEIIVLVLLYHNWNGKQLLLFAFGQGTVFQFWTPPSLKGYGVGTPNGALWTIGVMVQYYIIAWFIYKAMKKRKPIIWVVVLAMSFAISSVGNYITHQLVHREIIGKLYDQLFIKYLWLFVFGMLLAAFEEQLLPVLQRYWHILLAIALFFFWTEWDLFSGYYLGWSLFLTAGLIGFAYRYPQFSVRQDISFGLFLYHMTVVNAFVNFHWIGNWLYVIPTVLITVLLALLSTVTIGKISTRMKQ